MSKFAESASAAICDTPFAKLAEYSVEELPDEMDELDVERETKERNSNAIRNTLLALGGLGAATGLGYLAHKQGWLDPVYNYFTSDNNDNTPSYATVGLRGLRKFTGGVPGALATGAANVAAATKAGQKLMTNPVRRFLQKIHVLPSGKGADILNTEDLVNALHGGSSAEAFELAKVREANATAKGKGKGGGSEIWSVVTPGPTGARLAEEIARVSNNAAPKSALREMLFDPDVQLTETGVQTHAQKPTKPSLRNLTQAISRTADVLESAPTRSAAKGESLRRLREFLAGAGLATHKASATDVLSTSRKLVRGIDTLQQQSGGLSLRRALTRGFAPLIALQGIPWAVEHLIPDNALGPLGHPAGRAAALATQ